MALPMAAQAEQYTLLAFGDSLTQGYGLAPDDGLVPNLQAWLRAHGADVTVINAGVSGDTTAGGRARLDWSLDDTVDAVMVALGGNDLLRGLQPAEARANLEAMMQTLADRDLPVLLAGVPVPANYGAQYQRDFTAIYPDLAAEYNAVLVPDILAPLAEARAGGTALTTLVQNDGVHPSARGVDLVVAALGPKVLELLARIPEDHDAADARGQGGTSSGAGISARP
ncbi:arylesterase [Rhodobacteraceae bacterium]|nr:arylesterase [Paracoccaceae bacterium]